MNAYIKKLISRHLRKRKKAAEEEIYSPYELAKAFRELRISLLASLKDMALIAMGVSSAAFGLKGFLLPNNFIDGGATGISLLTSEITSLPFPVLLILVNIPFLIIGFTTIGGRFAVKTSCAILLLSLLTAFIDFPHVTTDTLLVAVFGGFFLGSGIGLAIRGGCVIDGSEILALYLSKKFGTTIGDIIIVINVIIFSSAAWLLSIDTAMYAMITYLAASKTVDFIIEGIDEYTGVTIISTHSMEIKEMIIDLLGRGVTMYKGKSGYGKQGHTDEKEIIYTVITRLEISKLKTEIEKIDPFAFIVMNSVRDIKGGLVKKRRLK